MLAKLSLTGTYGTGSDSVIIHVVRQGDRGGGTARRLRLELGGKKMALQPKHKTFAWKNYTCMGRQVKPNMPLCINYYPTSVLICASMIIMSHPSKKHLDNAHMW